jgi:hypothetical protein
MKIWLSGEQLYELSKHPALRVASTSLAPGKVYIGSLRFRRGEKPAPLEKYFGQMRPVVEKCKGRSGYAYTVCLREKAKELGIKKEKKR